nr:hypothetical protein [Tanacetum cinerariifolium]
MGCHFDNEEANEFNDFISHAGLFDFPLYERRFTKFDNDGLLQKVGLLRLSIYAESYRELEEFKKGGIMNDYRNKMSTYRDFTACDVPKFNGALDPIASTRWLAAIEGAFRTSNCKEKNKVNFASNFLRDSAKMWWEGKFYEKEIDRIHEEFQTLTQTNETMIEMWKKFNDLIRYCLEARVREANLLRKKNKETKETKMKIEFGDRDAKNPKHDQGRKSRGTQIKAPCKKCHKTYLGECRANLSGCYKCGALNHKSKDCKKQMIICFNYNQLGHKSNKCPNPKAIESKPIKVVKEEKVEKARILNPKARVYMMATEEDKVVHDIFKDPNLSKRPTTDEVPKVSMTDIVKLVVEFKCFGMSSDEFDKKTGSSDGLQPKRKGIQKLGVDLKWFQFHIVDVHVIE